MNKTINKISSPDLAQVKAEFEAWRATRIGKQRIPPLLWEQTVALLNNYSIATISRELQLDYGQIKQRAVAKEVQQQAPSPLPFLEIKSPQLATSVSQLVTQSIATPVPDSICSILFERSDGTRLSLSIPFDGTLLTNLCTSLLRA